MNTPDLLEFLDEIGVRGRPSDEQWQLIKKKAAEIKLNQRTPDLEISVKW